MSWDIGAEIPKNPGVSVIIPTYNRAQLLRKAILSVLEQTCKDFEIIIVDDASTDKTREVVKEFDDKRIRYIYHDKNQGGAAARNTGIKAAKGEYIAFLDSDDEWLPHKLKKQIKILEKYEDISVVYSNFVVIDGSDKFINLGFNQNQFPSGYIFRDVLLWKSACGYLQTMLVRKDCFEEIGYFDPEFAMAHDRDMAVRLAKRYKMYGMSEPLARVRQHNLTQRVRLRPAREKEYYWFKFLDKLFREADDGLISGRLKRRLIANYYFVSGKAYLSEMNHVLARKKLWISILNYPFRLGAYFYFVVTLMNIRQLRNLNSVRRLILTLFVSFRNFRYKRLQKFFIPQNYYKYARSYFNRLQGDEFSNPGPITDEDFQQIKIGIDEVKPKVFIEIGTGKGISTKMIYNYLKKNYPECHFYTVEIFKKYFKSIMKRFADCPTFHPLLGLSVRREETTPPAYDELNNYSGPSDILRKLFNDKLKNRNVDIAFIDSRKGSSLAEFLILEKRLSEKGIIFCHDINNNGKGLEVLDFLENHKERYSFQVINTGPMGMIKIRLK